MVFDGEFVKVQALGDDLYEIIFDNVSSKVNVLSQAAFVDVKAALEKLQAISDIAGVIVSSAKKDFILGADVTEFVGMFSLEQTELRGLLQGVHDLFNALEDLPCPTVAAVNGMALGGGCEVSLACDLRVMSSSAKIGLPEINLGIIPGWGGCVRLPRLIGADNALEWIASAKPRSAQDALANGVVDVVVAPELLRDAALDLLRKAGAGEIDYRARRAPKVQALTLPASEAAMAFETAKAVIGGKAGPHYPAPLAAVKAIQAGAGEGRDAAIQHEIDAFLELAQDDVSTSMIGLFLNSQYLKRLATKVSANARSVEQAAVLGAGIMGGGIAYQSALKGVPVVMRDINEPALDLGMSEATKQLNKLVSKGRMDAAAMAKVITEIQPTLNLEAVSKTDIVVEAVVENAKIKKSVLQELESVVSADAIITSNTSTISINELASGLDKPERFCGMHFFNPVPVMPLVEVIRGQQTSDETIATVVAYAAKIGKTPIVVNDCPGFLVNRILFPYFNGFSMLINEGAEFKQIDRVMERFGWPMGPAYLQDVVGVDTCCHAGQVMAEGFPDRMDFANETISDLLHREQWLGQKSGKGFYLYEKDAKGRPRKLDNPDINGLLSEIRSASIDISDEDIVARMMLPLCLEAVRCLDDDIVASAAELDMALIMGIGFPKFRGGALRYIDTMGLTNFVELADRYQSLGGLYTVPDSLRAMAEQGKTFF